MTKQYMFIAYMLAILLAVIFFGGLFVDSHDADFDHYCYMVEQGHWPDYKNQFQYCEE